MASATTPTACTSSLRQAPSPASKPCHCVSNNIKPLLAIWQFLLTLYCLYWHFHGPSTLPGPVSNWHFQVPERTLKESNNLNTSNGTLFASIRNLTTVRHVETTVHSVQSVESSRVEAVIFCSASTAEWLWCFRGCVFGFLHCKKACEIL